MAVAAVVGVSAIVALPSAANAAPSGLTTCDASALQLSLLGSPAIDPIHANGGGAVCADSDGTLVNLPLLDLVDVQAVQADTRVGADPKSATSASQVEGAQVGVPTDIVSALTGQLTSLTGPNSIVGQLDGLLDPIIDPLASGPVGGLLSLIGLNLSGSNGTGFVSGLTDALPGQLSAALPNVLTADTIGSTARATCSAGAAQLSGSSQLTNLNVLGTSVDPNTSAGQLLTIDTAALSLGDLVNLEDIQKSTTLTVGPLLAPLLGVPLNSTVTVYQLLHEPAGVLGAVNTAISVLTGGQSLDTILTTLTNGLQPALDAVRVNIPTGLLHATVTPNQQIVSGGTLTQNTLALTVTALNQPVLDGVLAQSRVSTGTIDCTPPVVPPVNPPVNPPANPPVTPPTVVPPAKPVVDLKPDADIKNPTKYSSPEAEAVLQCTVGPATLIDVYGDKGRTYVQGVAEKRFVGKTATIYLGYGHKKVGTAKIAKTGLFTTHVALPPSSIRSTNKARYYAVVGGKKTRALKFSRRMLTTSISSKSGTVTLKGQITSPRLSKQAAVIIKQRVSCKAFKTVATVKPDAKGRFSVTIKAPKKSGAAIYRAQTTVPKVLSSPKRFPTFTLPRVVGL